MKKLSFLFLIALMVFACNKDVTLKFESKHIEKTSDALIAINYPKAIGNKAISEKINRQIERVIASEMNMDDTSENEIPLSEAVTQFDKEYNTFKKDFNDTSNQKWEVKVEGQVVYESPEVICVSLETYVDTGGAHGNDKLAYLNFNPQTGALLEQNDIIKNTEAFKKIARKAFKEQSNPKDDAETIADFFFGEDFQLPENIGFTGEGLVLLYNNYEIASYDQGITKIVLPYNEIKEYLTLVP